MSALLQQAWEEGEPISVSGMCQRLGLSRTSYYRWLGPAPNADRDMELRDRIQRIALEWPSYGYRRVCAQLQREGVVANHKRVRRLLREDNLLCARKRRFCATTDSAHGLPLYDNLIPGLVVSGLDELWVADITYVRLDAEFIYLAVLLDAHSRRVIGWNLDRRLDTSLALGALRKALASRPVRAGLIHHSDRGVQYASAHYTETLAARGIRISMSRRGNPYDNAQAESFLKTLKYEEVYLREYATLPEARRHIGHFLDAVYNQKRLHSALGYQPPVEFEASLSAWIPALPTALMRNVTDGPSASGTGQGG